MKPTRSFLRRLGEWADILPEERMAAAVVGGVLYLVAGVCVAIVTRLHAVAHGHETVLIGLALGAVVASGVSFFALRDPQAPVWSLHVNQIVALAMVAVVVALSGGAMSPMWFYVMFPALFTAYFFGRPVAVVYLLACVAVQGLPLLYGHAAANQLFLARLISAPPAYIALGLAISTGKRRIISVRARAEMLAAEQGALRRVASAVAGSQSPEQIFALVAVEAAGLLKAQAAGIMRLEADGERLTVVGSWAGQESSVYEPGVSVPVLAGSDVEIAMAEGTPQRTDQHAAGTAADRAGWISTVVAPVRVGARTWGLLAVASPQPASFACDDEEVLLEFGDLLATAISSAEDRARLAQEALSDPLTGLANQRALRSRLEGELARAARHGSPVSVAIIDIDHFKDVNDSAGHDTGDEMLIRVAAALAGFARTEDILARIGGDEFAWILPDTTRQKALVAVERARRLIAEAPADPLAITISAGICDTDTTSDAGEILRLADSALYWSKEHGRNQAWIYDPAVVQELSEHQRAARIERSQALEGLRALVREREGRDPARSGHSERVASTAVTLATRLGWPRERAMLLGEAAMLHDIGPATRGEAPARLDGQIGEPELDRLRAAAQASARVLDGLLSEEQVAWIADQFTLASHGSDGGALVALADVWDLKTAVAPGSAAAVLAECQRLAGAYFAADAVQELAGVALAH